MLANLLFAACAICVLLAVLGLLHVIAVPYVALFILAAVLLIVALFLGGRLGGRTRV